jgi:hypothetical protein
MQKNATTMDYLSKKDSPSHSLLTLLDKPLPPPKSNNNNNNNNNMNSSSIDSAYYNEFNFESTAPSIIQKSTPAPQQTILKHNPNNPTKQSAAPTKSSLKSSTNTQQSRQPQPQPQAQSNMELDRYLMAPPRLPPKVDYKAALTAPFAHLHDYAVKVHLKESSGAPRGLGSGSLLDSMGVTQMDTTAVSTTSLSKKAVLEKFERVKQVHEDRSNIPANLGTLKMAIVGDSGIGKVSLFCCI